MDRLLWLDMEMTGLDVKKEVILEVAMIVTDIDFNPLDQFVAVFKQPQKYLDGMDDWNKTHHTKSGLIDRVTKEGESPDVVERKMLDFIEPHFPGEQAVLSGNSIAQDRRFIDQYLLRFSEKLHYRMLDVSSWKLIFLNKFDMEYEKKGSHEALKDIQESIEEMKFYVEKVQIEA